MSKNTKEIIEIYCQLIEENYDHFFPRTYSFDEWEKAYLNHNESLSKLINNTFGPIPSIKNVALKRVMHHLFIKSLGNTTSKAWDRKYVRDKYEKKIYGYDVLYYPAKKVKRLVVNFSSMGKDRYDRYSRYWDETEAWDNETAYIFFKDDNFSYYLGNNSQPLTGKFLKLIRYFMEVNELSFKQVYTVGSSMGGYAALYYGIQLEVAGCIVCSPQITQYAAQAHKYRNWSRHMAETEGQWVDLDLIPYRIESMPSIYIEYGNYPADKIAVAQFVSTIKDLPSLCIIRKAPWSEHSNNKVLSKETVDNTISYFENNGFAA